ncbi:MAG: nuclear transport factor 2 family protein [Gammaproteobacteria bacterium]
MKSEDPITLDAHDIRDLIDEINRTWLQGDPENLQAYFHPDMVIQPPGDVPRIYGIGPCIASYADFRREARIRSFTPGEAEIDVFGDTAVATYRYEIVYELHKRSFDEVAGELLVLLRAEDSWRVAWRTMLS